MPEETQICAWCERRIWPDVREPGQAPVNWIDEDGCVRCPLERVTLYHRPLSVAERAGRSL